ncbi:MAG: isochorismate synthase [bacterium]
MINFTQITDNISNTFNNKIDNKLYNSFLYKIKDINFFNIINNLNINDYFYWQNNLTDFTFLAIDNLDKAIFSRCNNFADIKNSIISVKENFSIHYENTNIPLIIGGVKFYEENSQNWENFSNYDFFIPKLLFIKENETCYLVINTNTNDISIVHNYLLKIENLTNNSNFSKQIPKGKIIYNESLEKWENKVNSAVLDIKNDQYKKVVIARIKKIELNTHNGLEHLPQFLSTLSYNHKDCVIFGYKKANSAFFGASPEKFINLSNNILETDALAGSALITDKGKLDADLDDILLHDKKNLDEHNQVLEYIIAGLKDYAISINYSKTPIVKDLHYIKHLWTPIKAELNDKSIIEIIESLFPTPAVCGFPKDKALEAIKKLETDSRGLYSGLVGWLNLSDNSEFYVSLRSALLKENFLYAFAGCGIVKGSDYKKEYDETESKFTPIINLVQIEN